MVPPIAVGFVFYYSWNLALRWLGVAQELPIVVAGHSEDCIALEKLVEPSSLNFCDSHGKRVWLQETQILCGFLNNEDVRITLVASLNLGLNLVSSIPCCWFGALTLV